MAAETFLLPASHAWPWGSRALETAMEGEMGETGGEAASTEVHFRESRLL